MLKLFCIKFILGRDYLLFIHTVFSSLAGITVLVTSYASSDYFSKSRAFVSTLFAGACTSASIWYSVFQVKILQNIFERKYLLNKGLHRWRRYYIENFILYMDVFRITNDYNVVFVFGLEISLFKFTVSIQYY